MRCPTCQQSIGVVKNRSGQQNRAYFGLVVGMLAEHLGYDKEDMHKALAGEFLGYEVVEINGKVHSVPKSTKSLNTSEFKEYAERIQRFAAEFHGLNIPNPNEPSAPENDTKETK